MNEQDLQNALSVDEGYIDDGGFTDRVLAELPRRRFQARSIIMVSFMALSGVLAAVLVPWSALFALVAQASAGAVSVTTVVVLSVLGLTVGWSVVSGAVDSR